MHQICCNANTPYAQFAVAELSRYLTLILQKPADYAFELIVDGALALEEFCITVEADRVTLRSGERGDCSTPFMNF